MRLARAPPCFLFMVFGAKPFEVHSYSYSYSTRPAGRGPGHVNVKVRFIWKSCSLLRRA